MARAIRVGRAGDEMAAIGLDHPGPHGQVMSFRYDETHSGLQLGDFHGVQLLYGSGMRQMTAGSSSE